MKKINLFKNYPIINGHSKSFIIFPYQKENNKWVGVEVCECGFLNPEGDIRKVEFSDYQECLQVCTSYNQLLGFDVKIVEAMVRQSMENFTNEENYEIFQRSELENNN